MSAILLPDLKYFIAVCEFGSISSAAEYLHIAQPSLSLAIKELESEFGTMLFNRMHRGMQLTTEGRLFLGMSKDIIERVDSAEKIMRDVGHNKKTLKLGIPPMIGSIIFPVIYNEFISQNADISLEIVECGREEMMKKFEAEQLDMAFVSHDRSVDPNLEALHVDKLEIVCSTSLSKPMEHTTAVSPGDLRETPLVMFKDGFFQTDAIKAWFARQDVSPNILMKTDQLSTMIKIITSGTAVGFLFKKLIENESNISWCHLSPDVTIDVSLVWQRNKFFTSSMKRFKRFIEDNEIFNAIPQHQVKENSK